MHLLISSAANAVTWTVDDDGKADFNTIQEAIQAASNGDEVVVMPGTYTGVGGEVVDMLGKSIWLHSSGGPEVTIIDGQHVRRGFFCHNGESNTTIIEGLTITQALASGPYPNSTGGGMRNQANSSPTITNCIFTGNNAGYGGGMYNNSSSPIVTDCTFTNNDGEFGGGMRNASGSNPTITNCMFAGNTSLHGGGIYSSIASTPTLTNTLICGNTIDQVGGEYIDAGGNTIVDICQTVCPDINADGTVNVLDLLIVIDQWGQTNSPADISGDGVVNVSDLLEIVGNWGPCI